VRELWWAGVALVLASTAVAASASLFTLVLTTWALVPWILVRVLAGRLSDPWPLTAGALGLLLAEAYVRTAVFLFPQGSTAPILLLVSPPYQTVVVLPVGLGAGWLLGRLWRRAGALGHAGLVGAGVVLVSLAAIATLRPGLLPTWAARAVSARERIGPPRVLVGEDFFEKVRLSTRQGWYQVGEFDDTPGEEIVSVAAGELVLLDPATGVEKSRRPLGEQARRHWNWFSRLVRDGAELLIVQTGGGFSDVEVLAVDGRPRWRFRPDADLPPVALLARDLDGDGRLEFYAASKRSLYRLDAAGQVVWERPGPNLVDGLDARGPDAAGAGRLLTASMPGKLRIWDAEGCVVGQLTLPDDDYRYKFLEWPRPGSIVGGSRSVRVFDPTGRLLLERALGDFRFAGAVTIPGEAGGPFLAVVGAGPRDLRVWRLLVLSGDGQPVYDEIVGHPITLLTAPTATGGRGLVVAGDGLWAYHLGGGGPGRRPGPALTGGVAPSILEAAAVNPTTRSALP
jgi:hypothetical protein